MPDRAYSDQQLSKGSAQSAELARMVIGALFLANGTGLLAISSFVASIVAAGSPGGRLAMMAAAGPASTFLTGIIAGFFGIFSGKMAIDDDLEELANLLKEAKPG